MRRVVFLALSAVVIMFLIFSLWAMRTMEATKERPLTRAQLTESILSALGRLRPHDGSANKSEPVKEAVVKPPHQQQGKLHAFFSSLRPHHPDRPPASGAGPDDGKAAAAGGVRVHKIETESSPVANMPPAAQQQHQYAPLTPHKPLTHAAEAPTRKPERNQSQEGQHQNEDVSTRNDKSALRHSPPTEHTSSETRLPPSKPEPETEEHGPQIPKPPTLTHAYKS